MDQSCSSSSCPAWKWFFSVTTSPDLKRQFKMRTSNLLRTIITVAALLHRLSYADTPDHPSERVHSESHGKIVRNRVSEAPHGVSDQKLLNQTPAEGTSRPNTSGSIVNNNPPDQQQLGGAGRTGLGENKVVSISALPVRPPSFSSFIKPTPKDRHHGPNPAVIGGRKPSIGNAASINGTGIKSKP